MWRCALLTNDLEAAIRAYQPYDPEVITKRLLWLRDHAIDAWIAARSEGGSKAETYAINAVERALQVLKLHNETLVARDGGFTGTITLDFVGKDG